MDAITTIVTKSFKWKGIIQEVGSQIQVPAHRLKEFEKFVSSMESSNHSDGKELPHYCQAGDCWCSEKLPGRDYPNGCVRINCEYLP